MATSSYKEEPRSLGVANLQASPGDHTHDGVTSREIPALATHNHDGVNSAAIPNVTLYTPTWSSTGTQPVLNNGSIYGSYYIFGGSVHLYIELTMGSTTTYGTGTYRFSLPVAANGRFYKLTGLSHDNSVASAWEDITGVITSAAPTLVELRTLTSVGASLAAVSSTVPITWAVDDRLIVTGSYGI